MAKKLITGIRYQKTVKDSLANLTAANRVYAAGTLIIETNPDVAIDDKAKVADGETAYNDLEYGVFPLIDLYTYMNPGEFKVWNNLLSLQPVDSNFIYWFRTMGAEILGESMLTNLISCNASTMGSGNTRGTWIEVKTQMSITELLHYQRVTGDYTASGTNGMALYKYNKTTGIATKVASTANLPNLWKAPVGLVRTPLTNNYVADPGLYLIAFRYSASAAVTVPSMLGRALDASSVAIADGFRFNFTTVDDFPTTIDMNTATQTSVIYWLGFA